MYDSLATVNKSGVHPNFRGLGYGPMNTNNGSGINPNFRGMGDGATSGAVNTSPATSSPATPHCGCSAIPGVSNKALVIGGLAILVFAFSRKGKR